MNQKHITSATEVMLNKNSIHDKYKKGSLRNGLLFVLLWVAQMAWVAY